MRVLKWIVGLPIALLIALAVIGSFLPDRPRPVAQAAFPQVSAEAQRQALLSQISLKPFKWTKDRVGRVEITGEFVNNSDQKMKDIEFTCAFFASSGTLLSTKNAVLYELAFSHQPVDLKEFLIGYVPDQVKSMQCSITGFKLAD